MMNKNSVALAFGVVLATIYATLVTSLVYGFWPGLHIVSILLMFVGVWVGFCLTGIWTLYRKGELDRKLPISGTEHRKRKRDFYEWLSRSQKPR